MFHGFCLLFFALGFSIPYVTAAQNGASLAVTLKEEAAVQGDIILLRDVAVLTGTDSARIQKLGLLELGPSPEFGSVRTLTRYQIAEHIQTALGTLPAGIFAGAAAVQIRYQGRSVDMGEISALLKAHLSKTGNWQESEIRIESIGNLNSIELPPGDAKLRISSSGVIPGRRSLMAPIEIVQNGKVLRSFWVTASVHMTAEILTAVKKIPSGSTVAAEDVAKASVEIMDLRASYARRPEDVIGKIARRVFVPGDLLSSDAFSEPFMVKHGDTVHLRLERNGIVLTSTVRAEQDGRLGQVIRVRNDDFSSVLKAQVIGYAQVVLQ